MTDVWFFFRKFAIEFANRYIINQNMKKFYTTFLLAVGVICTHAQITPVSQMEKLGRGVVAVPFSNGGTGRLVTWRLLGTDDPYNTTFDVLRGTTRIASNLKVTNYKDANGTSSSQYKVVTKVNGVAVDTTNAVKAWTNVYMKLLLDRPATGTASSGTYTPNDCSVGDVDGDGEYEIFVKWDPSTAKDNSQGGVTDNVYIDCYKLNGTKLWRIDLGRNIRAGAHYTQFQVYDYDGDGKAEMMCKTAPGSKDGVGSYVNQAATSATIKTASNTASYVTSDGRINSGHEYLTVFDGLTGKAIHTIAYYPNRNGTAALSTAAGTKNWDTRSGKSDTGSYGNRGERYLAATAYIDGPGDNASAIFCRGYYTYAYIWAVSFDGEKLIPRWLSSHENGSSYKVTTWDAEGNATNREFSNLKPTSGSGSGTMFQNGNHNMSVADVDGDGKDDIIWGSAALKHDGTLRYGTGFGHGDAIHMGAMIPGREGLQVYEVHEEKGYYSWDVHDAATGEILLKGGNHGVDNGRGMAAQLSANTKEWWFSSADQIKDDSKTTDVNELEVYINKYGEPLNGRHQRSVTTGDTVSTATSSVNFRIYWDGDVQDELLDGNVIDKYNDSGKSFSRLMTASSFGPSSTCNGSKNTPCISADLFGDWREELVLYSVSDAETYLGIYSTNIASNYAIPTLMHDHTYRMGICWQNTAYNQPPHLGYNLAMATLPHFTSTEKEMTVQVGDEFCFESNTLYVKGVTYPRLYLPDGSYVLSIKWPTGFTKNFNSTTGLITIKGTATETGDYKFAIKLSALNGQSKDAVVDTLILHVTEADGIYQVAQSTEIVKTTVYDALGRTLPSQNINDLPQGIYIIREETANGAVTRKIRK